MTNSLSKHWPWIVTAFLTLLLWLQTCNVSNLKEEKREQAAQITQLDLDKQTLKAITNQQEETILTQRAIVTQSQQAINNLTDTIFDLKKKDAKNTNTIAYLKLHQKVKIDSIFVPVEKPSSIAERLKFSDSIMRACKEVIDMIDSVSIQVPAIARVNTPDLLLHTTILKEGLRLDSLVVHDELNVRFVEHKGKLFKKGYTEVQFFHTNPYFDTQKANSVIYKPKKKSFFKTVVLPVAAGVATGLILAK